MSECLYVDCCYGQCSNGECLYVECCYAECLNVFMLSDIKAKLEKVKAHQDDKKTINQLTWFKYLNTKYNKKAKVLVQQEQKEFILFLFKLQSSYIVLVINNLTLNLKESILMAISLIQAKSYLCTKLKNKEAFKLIDWVSR